MSTPSFQQLAQGQGAINVNGSRGTGAPDCRTCPAFLDPMKQTTVLNRGVGAPICGKHLLAIGRPGKKDADKDPTRIAASCKDFGEPMSFAPGAREAAIEVNVAFPEPEALVTPQVDPHLVRSCQSCTWFVPERTTEAATGWRAGFCRAKGSLILSDRLPKYAKDCDKKSRIDTPRRDNGRPIDGWNLTLLPEHADPVDPNDPLLKMKRAREGKVHDPRTFEFPDKKVSALATKMGIRTWMPIEDPNGYGPRVFLPVFDLHRMDKELWPTVVPWNLDEELGKIPQAEHEDKPHRYIDWAGLTYDVTIAWVKFGETPVLWGPAGVGKTEFFRFMAWQMQLPFERVSITGRTDIDDIAGKMMFSPELGTYFHFGRLTTAWVKPGVLCVDEPNTGQDEIWQFIRPMTDNAKQLILDMAQSQRMPRNKAGYSGMAMNPAWDPLNHGAREVADPDMSRVTHIHLGLPPEPVEKGIILQELIDNGWDDDSRTSHTINTLLKMAKEIRALSTEGVIPISWGIRNQLKTARYKKYMPWTRAFLRGAADALEPEAREAILTIVRSHSDED